MDYSPYRKDYKKNIYKKSALFIGIFTLVFIILFSMYSNQRNKEDKKHLQVTPDPSQAAKNENQKLQPNNTKTKADPEDLQIEVEIQKTIDEINRAAQKNNQKNSGEATEDQLHSENPENTSDNSSSLISDNKNKEDAKPVKLTDSRRYFMEVIHNRGGGAHVFVTDSYTSEVRSKFKVIETNGFNVFENNPVKEGEMRFDAIIFDNSGTIDGGILDEYSGEFRRITSFNEKNTARPFEEPIKSQQLRYYCFPNFVDGMIFLYIMDTFTSHITKHSFEKLPTSIAPTEPELLSGKRRFFGWPDIIDINNYFFGIDTFTSEIIQVKDSKPGTTKLFEFEDIPGHQRFNGNVDYIDGFIHIFCCDSFTSEIRFQSMEEINQPIKLFSESDAKSFYFNRFDGAVFCGRGSMNVIVIDHFTSEVKIKIGGFSSEDQSIRLFSLPEKEGVQRYYARFLWQLTGGFDVYVIDSFTGEVRIKTHVVGPSLKLF